MTVAQQRALDALRSEAPCTWRLVDGVLEVSIWAGREGHKPLAELVHVSAAGEIERSIGFVLDPTRS